jgi:hypothetical protein
MGGDEKKTSKVKLDTLIIRDLWSDDESVVLKTIYNLRSGGNIHYIPELLRLLSSTPRETVAKELVRFLADVKDPRAVPIIISGLKSPELKPARAGIVSACWQSGMDYSGEMPLFIRLFLEGDYPTALESFTVIEESIMNLSHDQVEEARGQVLGGIDRVSDEKKPLARELVKLLEV